MMFLSFDKISSDTTKIWGYSRQYLVAKSAFQADNFTHGDVFGHLKAERFSAQDAAEYLEVSMPTFRRYVQSKKITPIDTLGRSQLFASGDLRQLKKLI